MTLRLKPLLWATMLILLLTGETMTVYSQNCRELKATYVASESRCTATGSIKVTASGGSGTYNYMVTGPTNVDYTSSNVITGLAPGTYSLTVKDISTSCTVTVTGVVVSGSYVEPRFGLTETDVTCTNGSDGTVTANSLTNGRAPYTYKLVSPSPSGVGTSNATGIFSGLIPGTYAVQLTDSCGAIQTRQITIQNYTWTLVSGTVTQQNCQTYLGTVNLTDSKGNSNSSGTAFSGFTYGVVKAPGDTTWFTNYSFSFNLGDYRTITLVAKDKCGQVQKTTWTNTSVPVINANPTIVNGTCSTFDVSLTGTNLTNAQYCLLTSAGASVPGFACNNQGNWTGVPYGSYCIKVTNSCYDTVITRCFTQNKPTATASANATASNYGCTTFTATVTGQQNLTNPQYCIFNSNGSAVSGQACNSGGVFYNLPYGNYTIKITDGCGTTLSVAVSAVKPTRTVAGAITISNYGCSNFTATLTGSGFIQTPTYCLYDNNGNKITCNNTGVFSNVSYGTYCIKVTDGCGDTTIQRCITATKPAPVGPSPSFSNQTCSGYTLTLSGAQYIFNGKYCLYDQAGNSIACNTTGIFNNVPYGTVCYKVTDSCTGVVVSNCVTQSAPTPSIGSAVTSNLVCSGFTATISNQVNLFSPRFCIYNAAGTLVGSCNNTGVFNNLPYGTYTIKTYDTCSGKSWTTTVTASKPAASVSASVSISSQTCTTFTASIGGIKNLTGASFKLVNSTTGATVSTNTNGVFTGLSYGNYCMYITSSCADTTITRCFTATAIGVAATATATPSCTLTTTDLAIKVTAGTAPYTVKVYDTLGNLITTSASFSGSTTTISGVPTLATAAKYKVVVYGTCGAPDTLMVTATPSLVTHTYAITQQCPSSAKANGSDNLVVTATSNLAGVNVSIVKKDGVATSISYNYHTGNDFTFSNLDAGTYVLTYTFTACSSSINDTVVLPAYAFPSLSKSSAYQCDNNSFSVGASVTGGIGPYTYEIIASNPSSPSIVTGAQSSPIFTINNNTQYNLIRLRAVDACGNAALNDVSVLPLANTIVTSTSNCINTATTLSTDALANATYTWYKKTSATDSVKLSSTTNSYTITRITAADTGTYLVKTSVNAGCLTRLSYFHLDGVCPTALAVNVVLQGRQVDGVNRLNWSSPMDLDYASYELERLQGDGSWNVIATISAGTSATGDYHYDDTKANSGNNTYRLHVTQRGSAGGYTNVVVLQENGGFGLTVFPNPASKLVNINIKGEISQHYQMTLYNIVGQAVWTKSVDCGSGNFIYQRDASVTPGIYILKVVNTNNGVYATYKIHFE